jgi:hypothetical protein
MSQYVRSPGSIVPSNKRMQRTAKPLRALSAADARR